MFKSEWLKRQDILLSFVANSFAAKVLVIVNKIILFWFLFINSGRYNNKKTGDYQEQRRMGLRMFGPKLFLTPHICEIFFFYCHVIFFHSRSRSRVFLGMIASDSHSRIVGMDFFHSLPVPELWEWIFFIPFPFPNFGNRFFHSLPIPEFWEWFFFIPFPFPNWGNGFFQFPSRSRTLGMELSIPVPVPELPNVIPAQPWLK